LKWSKAVENVMRWMIPKSQIEYKQACVYLNAGLVLLPDRTHKESFDVPSNHQMAGRQRDPRHCQSNHPAGLSLRFLQRRSGLNREGAIMSEQRQFEAADPADMEDELRERSENISAALDAAFERGQDCYTPEGDLEATARAYYDHPKLRQAFGDGWSDAAREELQS
jgi:hypothetical protein